MSAERHESTCAEVRFCDLVTAQEIAEGFVAYWRDGQDVSAMNEWARQLHDELRRVLYGDS